MSQGTIRWVFLTIALAISLTFNPFERPFKPFDPLSAMDASSAHAEKATVEPTATPIATPAPVLARTPAPAAEPVDTESPTVIETPPPAVETPTQTPIPTPDVSTVPSVEPTEPAEGPVPPGLSEKPSPPGKIKEKVIDENGGTISTDDGKVSIEFPKEAAKEKLSVRITQRNHHGERLAPNTQFVGLWTFEAFAADRGMAAVDSFPADLNVTMQFLPKDLAGLNPESLEFWTRSGPGEAWKPVTGEVDAENRTLRVRMNHFSEGGATAAGLFDFAPGMADYTVGLHTGSAAVNIPIEVPEGLGGLTPQLLLNYDSVRVNGMKTFDALGSWVGIGWDLAVGNVSKTQNPVEDEDPEDVYGVYPYSLEMPGAAGNLAEDKNTPGKWYTKQHDYLKIEFQNNTWTITDKSGTSYFFGETDESRQWDHHSTYDDYYRWNLSRIRDTKGNEIRITYWKQFDGSDVIAAYPSEIKYAYRDSNTPLALVRFNYLRDEAPPFGDTYYRYKADYGGYVRRDTTEDYDCNDDYDYDAPEFFETRVLEGVDVFRKSLSGEESLVRSYSFTYDLGGSRELGLRYLPDGTPFCKVVAGLSRLLEVSVKGSESNTLYTQEFTYCEKDDEICDDIDFAYKKPNASGSSMQHWYDFDEWPLLHTASNGFGGLVEFEYDEENAYWDDTEPYSLPGWSHRVVDEKRVVPGGGQPEMLTTYEYEDLRDYFPYYWVDDTHPEHRYGFLDPYGAEFRGARKVWEYKWAADGSTILEETKHRYYTTCYPYDPEEPYDGCAEADSTSSFTSLDEMMTGRELYAASYDHASGQRLRNVDNDWVVRNLRPATISRDYWLKKDFTFANFVYNTKQEIELEDGTTLRTRTPATSYDTYGNLTTVYNDGDTSTLDDDTVTYTPYHQATTPWIFLPKYKQVKQVENGIETDTLAVERYFYDGAASTDTAPTTGKLTAVQKVISTGPEKTTNTYYEYESQPGLYGRRIKESRPTEIRPQDRGTSAGIPPDVYYAETSYGTGDETPFVKYLYVGKVNGGSTALTQTTTYDTWDTVLGLPLRTTAPNGHYTEARYDEFGRPLKVWDEFDSESKPTKEYGYHWGVREISQIQIVWNWRQLTEGGTASMYVFVRTNDQNADVQAAPFTTNVFSSYRTASYTLTANPVTGKPWTLEDLNSLQVGFRVSGGEPTITWAAASVAYTDDGGAHTITSWVNGNGYLNQWETQWPDDGSPHYSLVDERYPDQDATRIKSSTPGRIDAFEMTDFYNWTQSRQRSQSGGALTLNQTACFDGFGRQVQTRTPLTSAYGGQDSVTAVKYDSRGLKEWETEPYLDGTLGGGGCLAPNESKPKTVFAYDTLGNLTTVTNPLEQGQQTPTARTKTYSGLTTIAIDENSHKKESKTDARGNVIQVKEYTGTGPYADYSTTTYGYDLLGNLTDVYDGLWNQDPNLYSEHHTHIGYDMLGRKTWMDDMDMGQWSYQYGVAGNLSQQRDANGVDTVLDYDALGRLISKSYDNGEPSVNYEYDSYDGGITSPECSTDPSVITDVGQLTKVEVQNGAVTRNCYDRRGRTIKEQETVDGVPYLTARTYDSADRLVDLTYPDGEVVRHSYTDSHGQLTKMQSITYGTVYLNQNNGMYTAAFQPDFLRLGSGQSIDKITIKWSWRSQGGTAGLYAFERINGPPPSVHYVCDQPQSQPFQTSSTDYIESSCELAKNPATNTTWKVAELDSLQVGLKVDSGQPQVTKLSVEVSYKDAYGYNQILTLRPNANGYGNEWETQNPAGPAHWELVADDVDATSISSSVEDRIESFGLTDTGWRPYVDIDYGYDGRGRVTSIRAGDSSNFYAQNLAYQYDGVGNVTQRTDAGVAEVMQYDELNRLKWTSNQPQGEDYDYDQIGRIIHSADYDAYGQFTFLYANPAHVHAVTSVQNDTYSYDANGNMTGGGFYSYTYNAENRLTSRPDLVGEATDRYTYDGQGNLVKRVFDCCSWAPSVNTTIYVGSLYERTLFNDTFRSYKNYYWAFGRRIAYRSRAANSQDPGYVYYFLADNLGSTNTVLDSGGAIVQNRRYNPYGSTRWGMGMSWYTDKNFTGQQEEGTALGLYDYGARFYSAKLGRFLSPDPLVVAPGDPQMLDRYAYVRNNPLRYTDPTGLGLEELTPEGAAELRSWGKALLDAGFAREDIMSIMLDIAYFGGDSSSFLEDLNSGCYVNMCGINTANPILPGPGSGEWPEGVSLDDIIDFLSDPDTIASVAQAAGNVGIRTTCPGHMGLCLVSVAVVGTATIYKVTRADGPPEAAVIVVTSAISTKAALTKGTARIFLASFSRGIGSALDVTPVQSATPIIVVAPEESAPACYEGEPMCRAW